MEWIIGNYVLIYLNFISMMMMISWQNTIKTKGVTEKVALEISE